MPVAEEPIATTEPLRRGLEPKGDLGPAVHAFQETDVLPAALHIDPRSQGDRTRGEPLLSSKAAASPLNAGESSRLALVMGSPSSGFRGVHRSGEGPPQRVRICEGGRLVVPSAMHRERGIPTGDAAIIDMAELRVSSLSKAIARAQAILRRYAPEGVSLADEPIADRRREAEREQGGGVRLLGPALLHCLLKGGTGAERVAVVQPLVVIGAVNLAGVVTRLREKEPSIEEVVEVLGAGSTWTSGRSRLTRPAPQGTLGPRRGRRGSRWVTRARLALAAGLGAVALTTDRE